ncbi:MAG: ribonuclease P protein subunit [Nanoarchaeota archaeon]|nr:ribonuclease P protein subunit [Nanoarchaeota archaeon]
MSNLKYEFIGSYIEVIDSKNKSLIGLKGKIVDETRNIITIKTSKGEKKLIKNSMKFRLYLKNNTIEIEGKKIVCKPEDRLKK